MENLILTKALINSSAFNIRQDCFMTTIKRNIDLSSLERSSEYFKITIVSHQNPEPRVYMIDKITYNASTKEFTLYNDRINSIVNAFLLHGIIAHMYLVENNILVTFNEE